MSISVTAVVSMTALTAVALTGTAMSRSDGGHWAVAGWNGWGASRTSCVAPTLPGPVVDVVLTDMGSMMGADMMGDSGRDRAGAMMGAGMVDGAGRYAAAGMMRIGVDPPGVTAGQVSLRVTNTGAMAHELLVLPLTAGDVPGSRAVGWDGAVEETGSLGEASATCAGGQGDGISPGAVGWVSLTLAPGRYELICNLPGHYAMGMYAELTVR